jgi:hypothetical protein
MKNLSLIFLIIICQFEINSQSVTRLLGCSQFDDTLRVFDTLTYAPLTAKQLTTTSGVITGVTGLSKNQSTGIYYLVFKMSGSRFLGTLNPNTGSVTTIGDLQDNFAGITFNGNNTLLGITGSGATVPNTIYRINTTNASKTSVTTGSGGSGGQSICYSPLNNKVYQWTGIPFDYYEHDTSFTTSSNITVLSSTEVFGSVYKTNGTFVLYDINGDFLSINPSGSISIDGSFLNAPQKGLAYITCPRLLSASALSVCALSQSTLTANQGGTSYQWYKNGSAITGATSYTYVTTGGGYFQCLIEDVCGQDTASTGLTIQTLPSPTVAITGNTVMCAGQSVTLTATSGGSSQWYKNGVAIPGATSNTYAATSSGVYNMIKTNLNGCSDSASTGKNVIMMSYPSLIIMASAFTVCPFQTFTLSASGAISYTWISPQNVYAMGSITQTISSTTNFTIIASNSGCTSDTIVKVSVSPCTGVTEPGQIHDPIEIFPNPASDHIIIEAAQLITAINLIDCSGISRLIKNNINSTTAEISLNFLPQSVYIAEILLENGSTVHKRVVLHR